MFHWSKSKRSWSPWHSEPTGMGEDDRARDMFAAQKLNEKISKELVTETFAGRKLRA